MFSSAAGVLFDGFAYGMLLFLLSVGLSVTLGMMNFVNLAHCSFAMVGGYATVSLTGKLGWPFLATLPAAFLAGAAVSIVLERTLYRKLYRASDLDQCLLTIGIVFISVQRLRAASVDSSQPGSFQPASNKGACQGRGGGCRKG
jgi:branched-chain amino acid transport system permease protein